MATTKTLNTRIQLKYDSYAEWTAKNPTLLQGEIAIAYLGPTKDDSTVTPDNGTHPVLFKVGPGEFNSLPWASALAADVHSWAKAATKPKYTASEIEGLDEYIAGEIQDTDTDTRYSFEVTSEGKLKVTKTLYTLGVAGAPEEVGQYDFVTPDELENILKEYYTKAEVDAAIKAEADRAKGIEDGLAQRVKAIEDAPYASQGYVDNAISTLENGQVKTNKEAIETLNGADTVEGSVAKAIKDARVLISAEIDTDVKVATDAIAAMDEAYKAADATLKSNLEGQITAAKQEVSGEVTSLANGAVKANTDAIAKLNGNSTIDGSVDKKISDALNDFMSKETADDVVNTYKELIDYAATHGAEAIEMATAIDNLEKSLAEGGATANAIADAKQAGLDAQDAVNNLIMTSVSGSDDTTNPVEVTATDDGTNRYFVELKSASVSKGYLDSGVQASLELADTAVQPGDLSYTTIEKDDVEENPITLYDAGDRTYFVGITNSSITETHLSASVNASLDLADTAVQPAALNDYYTKDQIDTDVAENLPYSTVSDDWGEGTNNPIEVTDASTREFLVRVKESSITEEFLADEAVTSAKLEKALFEDIQGKANDADLAAIAKTGNVNDLVQRTDEVLVFNCGSASSVF